VVTALFYVSRSTMDSPQQAGIEDIASVARSRNAALDVTGALVFTGTHFAQLLEGPQAAIEELMKAIRSDHRHRDVDVVLNGPVATRRFDGWSMAYSGPSSFVRRRIEPLVGQAAERSAAGRERAAKNMIGLMADFVASAELSGRAPTAV
jgi:hypothetical protein